VVERRRTQVHGVLVHAEQQTHQREVPSVRDRRPASRERTLDALRLAGGARRVGITSPLG
jgi:hypothetical protein